MRIARQIFLILGILLILLNCLPYLGGNLPSPKDPNADASTRIGFFIGANFLFVFGLIFIFIANRLKKRMVKKEGRELVDSLFNDK